MSQLNGAYYGPSIPPPQQKPYRRHGSDSGCCFNCCCGLFKCCCGCIFSLICKLLTFIIVIIAIIALLFWLIVRPNVVKFHVTDATLTQFNYTTNTNTLNYNLALNITVRNPNKRVGIYYDYIEARALYHDVRFGTQNLEPLFQHHKTTSVLSTVFKGQQVMVLDADRASELNKEKGSGVYDIDMVLYMKVRFKLGLFKTGKLKPKIRCDLHVPLRAHNGTGTGGFQTTECDWDNRWLWWIH